MAGSVKTTAVIDSSYLLAYLLPDEESHAVAESFKHYKSGLLTLISPHLLPFEVGNGMYAAVLTKRLSSSSAEKLIHGFLKLPIQYEDVDIEEAFRLSLKHKISLYDASYLLLARQKNIPLLTLDRQLGKLTNY